MIKELICITCPMGCHLKVELEEGKVKSVEGNNCIRGKNYAIAECTHPTRMLTTTVIIKNAKYDRLPVITSAPIPKELIFTVMKELNKVEVIGPVKVNDVIVKNILNLDIDILASRSM